MTIRDQFPARAAGGSAREAFAVTPDDDEDLPQYPQSLWVGGAGDVTVVFAPDSDPVTFASVPAGTELRISPSRVMETDTDATDIVGLV
jgi:hypothetical protein